MGDENINMFMYNRIEIMYVGRKQSVKTFILKYIKI